MALLSENKSCESKITLIELWRKIPTFDEVKNNSEMTQAMSNHTYFYHFPY